MQGPATWRNLARHNESFDDLLYAHLKKTPWWLVSAAVHGVLVFALFALSMDSGGAPPPAMMNTEVEDPFEAPLEDPVKPDIEVPPPIENAERDIVEETIDEKQLSDDNEDPVDSPHDQPFSDTSIGDTPFDGFSTNPAIGIGGGLGGGGRGMGGRRFARLGGSGITVKSERHGLEWLRNHQDPDGNWDCDGFSAECRQNQCGGPGHALYDPGVTGLALLAFLGAGETHRHGSYKATVLSGLKYLKKVQDPEGCFGGQTARNFTYNHAIATLAMTEAYALTGSPMFRRSAQEAVNFIHRCQNPYLAWRYSVRPGDNDTSVTGWMVMALKSARMAGLDVDEAAFSSALTWLDKVTEPEYGSVGYNARGTGPARPTDLMDRFPADKSESMTAAGILTRIFCGEDPEKSEPIRQGVDLLMKALPVWDEQSGSIDMYYWYYGTLAMFQVGGEPFEAWNKSMKTAIIDHQRKDGCEKGSWDPVGPWGREGGRVYSTALMTMCMEVYYRYDKVFGAGR